MRRRPRRPDGKRGRIKRRVLKKRAPVKWGTVALVSDDDRPPGDWRIPPRPRRDVAVVVWRDLRHMRRNVKGGNRTSHASYAENGEKIHHGSIAGTIHLTARTSPSLVVHEAAHASLHAERVLGNGSMNVDYEERFCYRLQRLCEAIWEYLAQRD